ncbi:unnamed protein product [Adineta ricciae]|uniref:Uncharacterized protein n=1 Tax=Adineta ricciae TaxID=249248 RepID=A0A814SMQ8_ADIRI|nr:unnamed protein product [Adineta ricciae]CAF1582883.1 unnamed protein product [Adineta ricciae]
MFKEFQNDFWQEEHHWYTLYVLDINSGMIFTIPYPFNDYKLIWYTNNFTNQSRNYDDLHKNVTNLQLYDNLSIKKYPFYFSNIKDLSIIDQPWLPNERLFPNDTIDYLIGKVNLSKLKHFDLSTYQIKPTILLQIVKKSPQLSKMTADTNLIRSFFSNNELCYDRMEQFFQTFSSLEELFCGFARMSSEDSWDFWISLINHIEQFSIINICNLSTRSIYNEKFYSQLQDKASKHNFIYRLVPPDIDKTIDICTQLKIWID